MPPGYVPVSPMVLYTAKDYLGRVLSVTLTFGGDRVVTGVSMHRDPGCLYSQLLIGIGGDGKPDSTTRVISVREGDDTANQGEINRLRSLGLSTVADYTATNITAK